MSFNTSSSIIGDPLAVHLVGTHEEVILMRRAICSRLPGLKVSSSILT